MSQILSQTPPAHDAPELLQSPPVFSKFQKRTRNRANAGHTDKLPRPDNLSAAGSALGYFDDVFQGSYHAGVTASRIKAMRSSRMSSPAP